MKTWDSVAFLWVELNLKTGLIMCDRGQINGTPMARDFLSHHDSLDLCSIDTCKISIRDNQEFIINEFRQKREKEMFSQVVL